LSNVAQRYVYAPSPLGYGAYAVLGVVI